VLQQATDFWQKLMQNPLANRTGWRHLLRFQLRLLDSQVAHRKGDAGKLLNTAISFWAGQAGRKPGERLFRYGLSEICQKLPAVYPAGPSDQAVQDICKALDRADVGGVVGTSLKWREAEGQRRVAVQEKQEADDARQDAESARNEAFKARHASQRQAAELLFDRGVALAEQGEAAEGLHWMLESLKVAPADAGDLRQLARTNLAAWAEEVHGLRNVLATPDLHVRYLAFSPDGRVIVTGSKEGNTAGSMEGTVLQWDRATGQPTGVPLRHRRGVEHVAFTPDGAIIATTSQNAHAAFLWDRSSGQRLGTPLWHQQGMPGTALSPDGKTILTAGDDHTLHLWQVSRSLSRPIDPNPGSRTDAGPGPRAEEKLPRYLLHRMLAYSPDRKTVLVSNGGKIARLWDTHTGRPLGAPLRHPRSVRTVAFSPDGTRVATSSHDLHSSGSTVHLWDAATGQPAAPPMAQGHRVAALAFSPDGRVLAMGDYGLNVQLWDLTKGEPLGEPLPQNGVVLCVAFSFDGRKLAVGTVQKPVGAARLWDVTTGKPIGRAMPHQNWVVEVAFSQDSKTLLTRSNDRTVRLWNADTSEPRSDYLAHQGLEVATLSPDGKTVATGGNDDRVRLWDATTGQPIPGATLVHGSPITALAYSPDGRILGVGCRDGSGRLWDAATCRPLGPPLVQRGILGGVAFLPDGGSFLTTAADGTTRLWPIPRPLEGDLDRITLRLQLRTGMQMDAGQGIARLDARTWQARRRQLVALEGNADGAFRSSVSDEAYHDARARDAEQDGAAFTALWHLDRLVTLRPDDWLLYARRGRAYSTAGQLDKADAEYRLAARHAPAGVLLDWYRHRVVNCVAAGQDAAAEWYRTRVLAAERKHSP
jgi:WD40 repeat protein